MRFERLLLAACPTPPWLERTASALGLRGHRSASTQRVAMELVARLPDDEVLWMLARTDPCTIQLEVGGCGVIA